ncbi:MAG: hypothetical protein FWG56_05850 [Desulfovibrionaceae bacterium]|jgi:phosphoserine phosphatase|nr:hypothetical protein [Desulfovibrionaceae bacterium]
MKLALFDLDHTLIAFDSTMAWTRFLADRSILPQGADAVYLNCCRRYVAGSIDIRQLLLAGIAPLARFALPELR